MWASNHISLWDGLASHLGGQCLGAEAVSPACSSASVSTQWQADRNTLDNRSRDQPPFSRPSHRRLSDVLSHKHGSRYETNCARYRWAPGTWVTGPVSAGQLMTVPGSRRGNGTIRCFRLVLLVTCSRGGWRSSLGLDLRAVRIRENIQKNALSQAP